ncbi:MAG TPA: DUF6064 family protein [Anaeromyxobacter sp.]|nr:DUF6064 family protein [Anaeromyxobacter sp.]
MPFTPSEFISLFERYNAAVWPLHLVTMAAALAVVALLATRRGRRSDVAASGVLVAFSLIVGVGYFFLGFARHLSPAGYLFGSIFVAEAALLSLAALRPGALTFSAAPGWRSVAGAIVIAYALVGYPVVGLLTGRPPVQSPWMGVVPCPTTIFTIGLLLRSTSRRPALYLVLPIVWSVIGTTAAIRFGVFEDLGMTAAAIVGLTSLLLPGRAVASATVPAAAA